MSKVPFGIKPSNLISLEYKSSKIVWIDQQGQGPEGKTSVATVISLKKKDKKTEKPMRNSVETKEPTFVKSILKVISYNINTVLIQ